MHVLTLPITGILFFSTSIGVLADISAGTVTRFDTNPHTMTLSGGEVISLPSELAIDSINSGDRVVVTWSQIGADRVATHVVETSQSNTD